MNYIEQIKGFWLSHEEHSFNTTEIALYFHLVEISNICMWKNPFRRNNAKIEADLGISFNTLKNARNKLQQRGIITFRTQNGSANVEYTLSKFDKVRYKVGSKLTDEVSAELLPTKDKLNKIKAKQESMHAPFLNDFTDNWKNNKDQPKESSHAEKKSFVKPTVEEVGAYCRERRNNISVQKFISYYESNGWRVGRNPMKDWQAAIRAWEQNGFTDCREKVDPRFTGNLSVDVNKF